MHAALFVKVGKVLDMNTLESTAPRDIPTSSKASFCVASRGALCCSTAFSGKGECNFLAFNENECKCTITLCEDLPDGRTRDSPLGGDDDPFDDGRCPYSESDTWIDSKELGCDDPCKNALSCNDCVDTGCTWSFTNDICSPACTDWETCIATPLSDVGISSTELCQETRSVLDDNAECESKGSCKVRFDNVSIRRRHKLSMGRHLW